MTVISPGVSLAGAGQRSRRIAGLLRALPGQVRLAMGERGVVFAAAAVAVGLLCIVVAFADIASSLETAEVGFHRNRASEIAQLDQTYRNMMRSINARSAGGSATAQVDFPVRRGWAEARAGLEAMCGHLDPTAWNFDKVRAVCAQSAALRERFDAEVAAFDPPRRLIDRDVLAEALILSTRLNELGVAAAHDGDAQVERMAGDYRTALLVLTLCTVGFAGAGLVLILLVGRTSMLHHAAWQRARATTAIMQETLDALPAGVVLYDKDERLVMFNKAAAAITPALKDPGAIGSTYAERAYASARQDATAGIVATETPEDWIARFRAKEDRQLRRTPDGRWVEWSEKGTSSGGTVGLRADVTRLKTHELEADRARAEYKSLVDSLSDAVYALDVGGRFTFASAAAAELIGAPLSRIVGARIRDFIVPEDVEQVLEAGRAFYRSSNESVQQVQFRMKRADGEIRHVEVRYRKPVGGGDDDRVQIGVIRDVTDRVELVAALRQQIEEVEEARAVLQETLDALPAGVVLYDKDERVVMFNKAAASITPRLTESDAAGMTYSELAHETARRLEAAGHGPQPVAEWIDRFRRKRVQRLRQALDGRWIDFSEQPTPSGRTVGLRVDVSEIKNREIELERARADYQSLVDSLSDMVFKIDARTAVITFASAAALDVFGIPPAQMVGTAAYDHIVDEDREIVMAQAQAALKDPASGVQQIQYRVRTASGAVRHVEARFRRMVDAEGHSTVSGVMRDIEERVQMARRLEEETARLRSIVESSGAILMLTDRDLKILMVNRELLNFWNVRAEVLIGRKLRDVIDSGLDRDVYRRWLAGENTDPAFYTRVKDEADGRQRLLSVTARPIADEAGVMRQIVFLAVDDTERRAAEQALFDTERMVTVGEMAATVAHEIAQPLQVINLAGEGAREELQAAAEESRPLDTTYLARRLERIGDQTERASRIISELRAFVRGTSDARPMPFDPLTSVQGAVDLTRHALVQARIALRPALSTGLPAVTGHVERLEQVLVNLINNARDAGAPSIELIADVAERDGRRWVRIAVDDSGPGIAPEVLPRLFGSFVTTKPRGKGTGLGLRICRRIVEEMGGSITASNRTGGGARFEILLPVAA